MTKKTTNVGKLSVSLNTGSYFLNDTIPIEIRDARLNLIDSIFGYKAKQGIDLPTGMYEVSSVLDNGHRTSEIVQVTSGENTELELRANEDKDIFVSLWDKKRNDIRPTYPSYNRQNKSRIRRLNKLPPDISLENNLSDSELSQDWNIATGQIILTEMIHEGIDFYETKGAQLLHKEKNTWTFVPDDFYPRLPTARFIHDNEVLNISLPVNPRGRTNEESSCQIKFNEIDNNLQAWIAPSRTVSSSMQKMLVNSHIMQAAQIAEQAERLLCGKYQDPVGAVLGALILNKAGKLRKRKNWMENLARDFDWLPDGKILLAQILVDDFEGNEEKATELIESASLQRSMFTESFSLMLGMVRQWPWENKKWQQHIMKILMPTLIQIDWTPFCLTTHDEVKDSMVQID